MTTDCVDVFVPTSPAPWHPSTDLFELAVNGTWKMFGSQVRVCTYCDAPDPWRSDDEIDNYHEYVDAIKRMNVGPVVKAERWIGLAGLVSRFILGMSRPIVFTIQHDWELLDVNRVDAPALLCEMRRPDSIVKYVRFHRKKLSLAACSKYYREYETIDPPAGLPLIASNGWGDSPHIATAAHYRETVAKHIVTTRLNDGRYGVERPLWAAYRTEIRKRGFVSAHKRWGSWFYGNVGDAPYMQHLGREQAYWRRAHELG